MNENVIEQPVAVMYLVSKELNRLSDFTTEILTVLQRIVPALQKKQWTTRRLLK